jgi:hypothetical protein
VRRTFASAMMALVVAGCAGRDQITTVDTRAENVGHQRLAPQQDAAGGAAIGTFELGAAEGYRMPQLYAGPQPVVGDRDPRQELPPTRICLQVVVNADGRVERSVLLNDRTECAAGALHENAVLVQAAQEAVAQWRYSSAAVCHFAAGKVPEDRGDCRGAERIEPVPVSLLYAFTFEVVRGQQTVTTHR